VPAEQTISPQPTKRTQHPDTESLDQHSIQTLMLPWLDEVAASGQGVAFWLLFS
jgi:hypothetical protein